MSNSEYPDNRTDNLGATNLTEDQRTLYTAAYSVQREILTSIKNPDQQSLTPKEVLDAMTIMSDLIRSIRGIVYAQDLDQFLFTMGRGKVAEIFKKVLVPEDAAFIGPMQRPLIITQPFSYYSKFSVTNIPDLFWRDGLSSLQSMANAALVGRASLPEAGKRRVQRLYLPEQ